MTKQEKLVKINLYMNEVLSNNDDWTSTQELIKNIRKNFGYWFKLIDLCLIIDQDKGKKFSTRNGMTEIKLIER